VTGFKHPALKQLTDQQVRFAPPARRAEQLTRAKQLLGEIEPARSYPYQFICFRITDYRPDSYPDLLIEGGDLLHDLDLLIKALAVPGPAEEVADPIITLDEISKQLSVSTKTIRRWQARAGRPSCDAQRQEPGRLPAIRDRSFYGAAPGSRAAGQPLLADVRD